MTAEDLALLVATLLLVVVGGFALVIATSHRKTVRANSDAIAALVAMNAQYAPRITNLPNLRFDWVDQVNSKAKFDRYDLFQYFLERVSAHEHEIDAGIARHLDARSTHLHYLASYDALGAAQLGRSSSGNLDRDRFNRIEKKLFTKQKLAEPKSWALVHCVVNYTSPQGKNSYTKRIELDFGQLHHGLEEVRRIRHARGTTQFLRQRERSKMTARLRAEILRRDQSRCQMCGRTAMDGIKLHIDHIVAVSHGGQTIPENLQTLCEDCNLGKSNRF